MNYKLINEFPNEMLQKTNEPCLSIYMPTHRLIVDNRKDVLVFKNLVKEAVASLEQKYSKRDISPLVSLLKQMEIDFELWNHSLDGLAIFATLDEMIIYRTEKTFQPIAIISDSFHIKPLIQYYQAVENFTLLALESESFALYQGNHLEIKPIALPENTKITLAEVLGNQHTENYQTHGGYAGASDNATFHGHGGKADEEEIDRIKYFRHVDRFVHEDISKKNKLPLILVALKANHFDFKNVSTNPFLLEEAIDGSYNSFQEQELKTKLKSINDKRFDNIINQATEHYHNLKSKDLSSDQLIIVLKALLAARVDTLMIEADKIIPGKIDIENQQIKPSNLDDPKTDDLLDDMVQHALKTGAKIYLLEPEKMPSTSGVAATFRF